MPFSRPHPTYTRRPLSSRWCSALPLLMAWMSIALLLDVSSAWAARPNVIVILADDLGYHDLGVQGATDVRTPHIDSLARNGVRFTSGYVTAPICSPSRAGLMTGRYQQRYGYDMNPGPELEYAPHFGIPLTETPLSQRMKSAGYATGMFGKSHLGGQPRYRPLQRGFDQFFGFIEGEHAYLRPGIPVTQRDPIRAGDTPVPETNYLTSAIVRETVDFIGRHAQEPFFLYLPFNAVHEPLEATKELLERFRLADFPDTNRYVMAAMLAGLDDAVGEILSKLRQLNLETNTLIVFTSDNGGPTPFNGSLNIPFRGYKTEVYEGGIRVPFLMQWKGVLPTNVVYQAPVSTLDILPTAMAAAGVSVSSAWRLDGVNLLPYVLGQTNGVPHSTLFWRIESENEGAVRSGDWKLLRIQPTYNWSLYNLAQDPGETTDLADQRPEVVQDLLRQYEAWAAELPLPAWSYRQSNYVRPDFFLSDVRIGSAQQSYLAPEFLPGGSAVVFQDGEGNLWRGDLDLQSGFFYSGHGRDALLDAGASLPDRLQDGPEWGVSSAGASVFYRKAGPGSVSQIWQAVSADVPGVTRMVTDGGLPGHFAVQASRNSSESTIRLAIFNGPPEVSPLAWLDVATPSSILSVPQSTGMVPNGRWLPDSPDLAFAAAVSGPGPHTQIARYRSATRQVELISGDAGEKSHVWPFLAPELGGELCYAAVVDHTSVGIYRGTATNPGQPSPRIATLSLPTNSPHRFIYSLAPLAGLRGFNGVSYFTCVAHQNDSEDEPGDSSIWILSLGPDPENRLARRVDAGVASGVAAYRHDPRSVLGTDEVLVYYSLTSSNQPVQLRLARTGLLRPEHRGPASGFDRLAFSSSWSPGSRDTNGILMGGTEVMHLVPHAGRLFAGVGAVGDFPYPSNSIPPTWTGAQVLVKDAPGAGWRADAVYGDHVRVDALAEVTFTTTGTGVAIDPPLNVLLMGLLDIGSVGSRLASVRARDDRTGEWLHSEVTTASTAASTLCFGSHVDRVTGIHHVFAGLSDGEIFRGSFNSRSAGYLDWAKPSELSDVGPVTGFVEANGFLYAACSLTQPTAGSPVAGGIYVRRDNGPNWRLVYRWPTSTPVPLAGEDQRRFAGLSVVPEPHGADRWVLIGARANPGLIERIDPGEGHAVTVELDVHEFLARTWGNEAVRRSSVAIAYTGFMPAQHPVTREAVHLIGLWVEDPATPPSQHSGSHFLIRHFDATYELAEIPYLGPSTPPERGLRATRCIAASPFVEDGGRSLYFGGYDVVQDVAHDTAWILRGDWTDWPRLAIDRPELPAWQLTWPLTATNWVLETTRELGLQPWQPVPGLPTRSLHELSQEAPAEESSAFFRLRLP